jgi:predicted DNA-binding transcriptional regulator AlpA
VNTENPTPNGDGRVAVRRSLTVEQLALLIGLSVTSIRTYVTCKRYQHLVPRGFKRPGGRRWLWWADEVEDWMQHGRPATTPRTPRPRGRPTRRQQLERRRAGAVEGGAP